MRETVILALLSNLSVSASVALVLSGNQLVAFSQKKKKKKLLQGLHEPLAISRLIKNIVAISQHLYRRFI